MLMYLCTIIGNMTTMVLINWLALGWTWQSALAWVCITTGIEFAITIVLAVITGLCMPKKVYQDGKFYTVKPWEIKLYRALWINLWKDRVCELGALGGFSKRKVAAPNDLAYVERFIMELNKGMFMHLIGIFGSFLVLLAPVPGFWSITLPVAMTGAFLNLLPLMVLRYNKPRLLMLKARLERHQNVVTDTETQKENQTK